jgi:hypothetical protein
MVQLVHIACNPNPDDSREFTDGRVGGSLLARSVRFGPDSLDDGTDRERLWPAKTGHWGIRYDRFVAAVRGLR